MNNEKEKTIRIIKIKIKKKKEKRELNLSEIFTKYNFEEINWENPVGEEIW